MTNPKIVVEGSADFHRLYGDMSKAQSGFSRMGRAAIKGAAIGFGLAGAAAIKFGIDSAKSLERIERINSQTSAAIKSTGGAAGVSAKHIESYATKLEGMTATEAESIQEGENFLLTFTNIRNAAGKNNKIFDQATVAMTDMSRALDKTGQAQLDTRSQALLLGKALNDPIKGMSALQRVGVAFTDEQKKSIAAMVESGDTMGAQKVILHELTKEFGGSGEAFAKTTTGKIEQAKDAFGDFGQEIVKGLLPAIGQLADKGTAAMGEITEHSDDIKRGFVNTYEAVKPLLDELGDVFGHLTDQVGGSGDVFNDKFLPALSTTADVLASVIDFVDELPGPVKSFAAEAGIAAFALVELNSGLTIAKGKMSNLIGPTATAETRMKALQKATRAAAGVAGMVLLAKSTQESNTGLSALESAAGGAAAGFSVAGPWGAVAGTVAGVAAGIWKMKHASDASADAMAADRAEAKRYKDTLDQLTGAITDATRAEALKMLGGDGAVQTARSLGVTSRQLVNAYLGQHAAIGKVTDALRSQGVMYDETGHVIDQYDETNRLLKPDLTSLGHLLEQGAQQTARQTAQIRRATKASHDYGDTLKHVPKKVETFITNHGILPTVQGIAKVVKKARELAPDLKRRDIKAIIAASGVDATVKQVERAIKVLNALDKEKPNPKADVDDKPFKDKHARILASLRELDRQYVKPKSTLTLDEYYRKRAELLASLHTIPDEYVNIWTIHRDGGGGGGGGGRVGSTGPATRVIPDTSETTQTAEEFGRRLVDAMAKGILDAKPKGTQAGKDAGKNLLASILAGVTGGTDKIRDAIDKINKLVEKRTKDDKAGNARQKAILRGLADEYAALVRNGKAQDEINRKLEKAKQHLQEVQQWVATVKQSFIDTGNVVQLGQLDDGTVSGTLLLDQLRDKVARAQEFAALIRDLTDGNGPQINQTTLDQLLQAGPEAGLATAQALADGGSAAIDEINRLTQQLAQTGQELGSQMSNQFFDVGLQAAQGLVDGLKSQEAKLDKIAQHLAHVLANAVRHALKIHSPSQEFRDIGLRTVEGLVLGLDDTYVKAQGAKVAAALADGFASPRLSATATGGGSSPTVTLRLTADQVSQLSRGKALTLDIDAGSSRGVRRLNVGGR